MSNKDKYREFCKKNKVALYQSDWWFDAVCGDNWDAIVTDEAAFAFPLKKKYGLKLIQMPMLTLGIGPVEKNAGEKGINELSEKIPAFDLLDLYFLPGTEVFHWEKSKIKERYTYRLKDISDMEKVFRKFSSSTRQQIRKAEKKVKVETTGDINLLYKMVSQTFKRQGKKTPYSLSFVKSINETCRKNNCRKIIIAKDVEGNVHGACFIAWDTTTAYYIMGGADPKFRNSAAYSLLMWEAIKEASVNVKEFDFCGSMIPSIEKFISSFGGERLYYSHLKKINSKALKIFLRLKGE